jgi:hypothetical protein
MATSGILCLALGANYAKYAEYDAVKNLGLIVEHS